MKLTLLKTCRAVIRGKRGITVTLPREWVVNRGFQSGDEIQIFQAPGAASLVLRKKTKNPK